MDDVGAKFQLVITIINEKTWKNIDKSKLARIKNCIWRLRRKKIVFEAKLHVMSCVSVKLENLRNSYLKK